MAWNNWNKAWPETIHTLLNNINPPVIDDAWRQRYVSLVDLTSLNATDSEESIALFCQKARTAFGDVAGVCVYPPFVRLIADQFQDTAIKAITVANFPTGNAPLENVLIEINQALENHAQEIDVVFPYQRYLANDASFATQFISACKAACGEHVLLKVILETGALRNLETIANAAALAFAAGADFIKTSTGKITHGASLEAAAVMLLVANTYQAEKPHIGVKVSGGIRREQDAALYMALAETIMGQSWLTASHFRIGASRLTR